MAADSSRLKSPAFSDQDIKLLDQGFQLAWERFLKTGMMNAQNMCDAQRIIAQRIIASGGSGERDPWRLARDALFHLWDVMFTGEPLIKVAPRRRKRGLRGRS
jgi:hypothetical protein